jgi:hypothetical protein
MLPLVEWSDERAQLWERKALNTISAGGEFPAIIGALGRLDCFLRRENTRCVDNFATADIPNAYLLEDFLALSQLWVFGAFENGPLA